MCPVSATWRSEVDWHAFAHLVLYPPYIHLKRKKGGKKTSYSISEKFQDETGESAELGRPPTSLLQNKGELIKQKKNLSVFDSETLNVQPNMISILTWLYMYATHF